MFNILKNMLAANATLDVDRINDRYRLRAYARNEFEPKVKALLSNTTTAYLTEDPFYNNKSIQKEIWYCFRSIV